MNKKMQMLLGVAVLAGVGFYLWKQSKATTKKALSGDADAMSLGSETEGCPCKKVLYQQKNDEGKLYNICDDQSACPA